MEVYLLKKLSTDEDNPWEDLVDIYLDENKAVQALDKLQEEVGELGACIDTVEVIE